MLLEALGDEGRENGRATAELDSAEPQRRKCDFCGKAFLPTGRGGPRKRFCSPTCRKRASQERRQGSPAAEAADVLGHPVTGARGAPRDGSAGHPEPAARNGSARPKPSSWQPSADRADDRPISEVCAPPPLPEPSAWLRAHS